MQKQKRNSTRIMVMLAMLVAISIVAGKMLAFNITDIIRFSVENLPIIFAGMFFGPIAGMTVGLLADLIGCFLVGYAINPLVTLGAVGIGLISGLVPKLSPTKNKVLNTALSVFIAHLFGSVIIKSIGLSAFYAYPLHVTMLWRGVNYLIVGVVECMVLVALQKSSMITSYISALTKSTGKANKEEPNNDDLQ